MESGERGVKTTIWARLGWSGRGRQPSLTHDDIAAAAVEIADSEGLEAVTMRRVSGDLGVGTMSLYRYLNSRDDLVDLMNDRIIAELIVPVGGRSWREVIRAIARDLRRLYLRHSWAVGTVGNRTMLGPNWLTWIEQGYAAVDRPGLTVDQISDVTTTVWAFVLGFVHSELAERELQRTTGLSEAEWRQSVAPYVLRIIEGDEHQYLKRLVIEAEDFPNPDLVFERRLSYVVAGLAAGLGVNE